LARLHFIRQNFDQALASVDTAIKLNGRLAMAHNLRGLILEAQHNLPDAIESYKQAHKLVPDEVNFGFNLGAAYYKSNDWPRAAEVLEKIAPQVIDPEMRDQLNSYLRTIKEKKQPA
jgi:tetratricopeptide (TPR) repeat protein